MSFINEFRSLGERFRIFWGKKDRASISLKSPEYKQKGVVKNETWELKAGNPQKEAPEKLEIKPEISEAKGKVRMTSTVEEPKQEIREPAANIHSTDTTAISVKKGNRFLETFDERHHISVIDFTPSISRDKTSIRIEKLKATSHLVEEIPPNIILENFNIWANIPEKDIDKPVIVFKVDKSWIAENNLREIQLYKYIDHEWVLQGPSEKLNEDEEYFYFQTPLKGLSGSYAIVGI